MKNEQVRSTTGNCECIGKIETGNVKTNKPDNFTDVEPNGNATHSFQGNN